jgi:regulator of replication initiation timing
MEDLSVKFANLFDKVETLMVKYARSREENSLLKAENEELRQLKAERDLRIRELDDKITMLRTVREISQDGQEPAEGADRDDRAAIRNKVNEYIKEIDRCIALLSA